MNELQQPFHYYHNFRFYSLRFFPEVLFFLKFAHQK